MTRTRSGLLPAGAILAAAMSASTAMAQTPPDRSQPPATGPAPRLTLPAIQRQALSNGLRVWLVEQHEVPIVQVNLVVGSGSAADPAARPGTASVAADMLDEGAGTRDALALADAVEFLGARLTTSASWDESAIRLSVPVSRLADALPLMADVALEPTFPADELERLRKERLTSKTQERDDPAAIVRIAFPHFVFGTQHRYGTPADGTEASLQALTLDDLRGFYTAHYRPDNATLIVVGDVTAASVVPLLERAFGTWKAGAGGPGEATADPAGGHDDGGVPAAKQLTERRIYLVDKPGAAQSQIRIGWVGVPRTTSDYATLQVLNTILGGSFTSRLNQNLREKNGYSYGAASGFDMRRSAGPFLAAAGVQTDKTADALREFFNELDGIHAPVPEAELAKAKSYVVLSFPAEFETTGDLARKLEELLVYGLPDDTFTAFVDRVGGVTAADVQKAAAQYIQPDKFAVVVVGDSKVVEAGIRALNLGPVQVLSVEDAVAWK